MDLNKRFICLETKGMKIGCRDARRERQRCQAREAEMLGERGRQRIKCTGTNRFCIRDVTAHLNASALS